MSEKENIIRLFHVYKRYGAKCALYDVSLEVPRNEFLFISGPSGAGKSTLMKLLYLGETASEGQILIDGMNLSRISRKGVPRLRRKFGIIFQDFKLIHRKTVFDNIAFVLEAAGESRRNIEKRVAGVLRTVGMEKRRNAYPLSLSGGEQQRVAVARAVVGNPEIILADEPTGSLDAESAEKVMELISGFHRRGGTVIVASHNRDLIKRFAGRTISLREGAIRDDKKQEREPKPSPITIL